MPTKSIARNTAIDSAASAGVMVFSLLAGIILARTLGDEGRGIYVFTTSFAGVLLFSLVNLGLENACSVFVAKNPRRLAEVHTLVVAACVTIGVVLALLYWMLRDLISGTILPGIGTMPLALLFLALPFWVYQYACYGMMTGLGRIRDRALFDLAFNFTQNLVVVILLVGMPHGAESGAITPLIVSYYTVILLFATLLPFTLLAGRRLWAWPRRRLRRDLFRFGFWVFVGNMGANLGQRIDQYGVKAVSGDSAAFGVYTLAASLTERTRILPQALSRSAYPHVCRADQQEAARLVAACFRQVMLLGFLLLIGGGLLSPLIPIVYTSDFAGAIVPFVIFLLGRMFHNGAWMLSMYFSGHLARPRIAMAVNWLILPVQVVLVWVAMRHGGLVMVSLVTALTYFFIFLAFLMLFLRMQKHVVLAHLFQFTREDLAPWGRLLAGLRGAGK